MTNEEILKKAIEKAVKNGYGQEQIDSFWKVMNTFNNPLSFYHSEWKSVLIKIFLLDWDFAKAFWGNKDVCLFCGTECWDDNMELSGCIWRYDIMKSRKIKDFAGIKEWQYHLQKMLLEEEPIKYLERFLEEK